MKAIAKLMTVSAAAVVLAGCSASGMLNTADADQVAFGTFSLVKNGHDVRFRPTMIDSAAHVRVRNMDTRRSYSGTIDQHGHFALTLPAGEYVVEEFSFAHQGETIQSQTSFLFTVPEGAESVYVGSISLEATVESSNFGAIGTADRYVVANNYDADSASVMESRGLDAESASMSLVSWDRPMANVGQ